MAPPRKVGYVDVRRGAGPIPPEHTAEVCEERGCSHPFHQTEDGTCLACGGCGDPACCGGHDHWCAFEDRAEAHV